MSKNSQQKNSTFQNSSSFSFKLQTLINELLPILFLLELPASDIQGPLEEEEKYSDRPMAAYQFKNQIKDGYVKPMDETDKTEKKGKDFDIRPGLLYPLLNELAGYTNEERDYQKPEYIEKDGNDYRIKGRGLKLLIDEVKRLDKFIECYQNKRKRISKLIESLENEK